MYKTVERTCFTRVGFSYVCFSWDLSSWYVVDDLAEASEACTLVRSWPDVLGSIQIRLTRFRTSDMQPADAVPDGEPQDGDNGELQEEIFF